MTSLIWLAVAWAEPTSWTARTPIGDIQARTDQVRLVHEDLAITLVDLDSYEVRATYQVHNPGERVIVRYGVPITSGGREDGGGRSNAASVRILQDGVFIPCLIEDGDALSLPVSSESGMHTVDKWCTADLVFKPGASEIRLSYEAGLLFERQWAAGGPQPTERQLVYAIGLSESWAGTPDAIEISVDLGNTYRGRARATVPPPTHQDERFLSWSWSKPDLSLTPTLVMQLAASDLDRFAAVTPSPTGRPASSSNPEAVFDKNPTTAHCWNPEHSLELHFQAPSDKTCNNILAVVPGAAEGIEAWLSHGRLKKARLQSCSDATLVADVNLKPTQLPEAAVTELPKAFRASCVRLVPVDVLPGANNDVCISELMWHQRCD